MVVGCDAVLGITGWHRWQELLDVAHIIVIARPGWVLPEAGDVGQWLAQHRVAGSQVLKARAAGAVLVEELRPLAISSTEVREMLATGRSARYLLPEPVLDYIHVNNLYQC
jgi:nicotinate-nucleotide adenylyltransferase